MADREKASTPQPATRDALARYLYIWGYGMMGLKAHSAAALWDDGGVSETDREFCNIGADIFLGR